MLIQQSVLILQPFSLLELKRWEYLHWTLGVMFLFVCLFGVYRPIPEFFTHMETSPLPVKGCKF